jgi:hypothetical protein
MPAARRDVIEGRPTLVVQRTPPLPQKLDGLLGSLTHVTYRDDIRPGGTARSCELRNHRFARFREGTHIGTDGIVRDVALRMCVDCGAVEVRDTSYDRLPGLPTGRKGPARRDELLGWYSGARRNQREYK